MTTQESFDEYANTIKEALTPEAWAKVNDFEDVAVSEEGVCQNCWAVIPYAHRWKAHKLWHRKLTLAVRVQGFVVTKLLAVLTTDGDKFT